MAKLAKRGGKTGNVLPDLTKDQKTTVVDLSPITTAAATGDVTIVEPEAVEKSAHDQQFIEELILIMDAPSVIKRGPVVLLDRWYVAEQDMSIFPKIGSKFSKNSNLPYDLRTIRIKKADGTPGNKWASWYGDTALTGTRGWIDDMLDSLPDEQNPNWHIEQCDAADPNKNATATGIYSHLASNGQELKAMRVHWRNKRNAALRAVKQAAAIHHQIELVNAMDNVSAEFAVTQVRNKEGELETVLSTTDSPLRVYDKKRREFHFQYTVSSFLSLKPYGAMLQEDAVKGVPGDLVTDPFAAKKDATVDELHATRGKGPDEEGEDAEANPDGDDGLIKTVEGLFGEITRTENFIDDDNKAILLNKALSAKGEKADSMVIQLVEYAATIQALAAPHMARYSEIKAKVGTKKTA